jgi:hypothetical protein
VYHVGFIYDGTDKEPTKAITGSADFSIKIWALVAEKGISQPGNCLRTIKLSGPASCLSFWPRGDGKYDPNCFIATSGKSVFKIDTSRDHCPPLCPRELQQFVIFPDLRDKKWERTKDCMVRLSGSRHAGGGHEVGIDYSGCLLQRITRKGETGLPEAIKTGNFELARVLCSARGGSTSVVLGMDFRGSTPWGVAIAKYCISNDDIESMSEKDLLDEAEKRGIDAAAERLNTKQIRDRLKLESSIEEYKKLCEQLDLKGCLDGVQCGVFPFVAAMKSDPSMMAKDAAHTYAAKSMLVTLVNHAELFENNKGFTIFDNAVANALVPPPPTNADLDLNCRSVGTLSDCNSQWF